MTPRDAQDVDSFVGLRPEIASSWKRVLLGGLDPATILDNLAELPFDSASTLLLAAEPVLAALEASLRSSSFCVLLADRDCRIVHRWFDDTGVESIFDELGARPGTALREEQIGTNALGTAFELRRGSFVHGSEHFAEPFKQFSCYGQPIRHPLTHRIEGVLDITNLGQTANPLLAPVVARAVADIEQGLLDRSRSSELRLLAAFQAASTNRHRAVAALGDNLAFSNEAASQLLEPADYALMRVLMADQDAAVMATRLSLSSGELVNVELTRITGSGTLFHIDRGSPAAGRLVIDETWCGPDLRTSLTSGVPVLISGAPGTGRTTAARELARQPLVLLNPSTALLDGDSGWANEFRTLLRVKTGTLCVEGIDQLSDPLLALVIESIGVPDRPDLVLTSAPRDELTGLARTLASMCVQRVDLTPLSHRSAEIPELALQAIARIRPEARVRLAPATIQALAAQAWPGNLHELTMVMTHAVAHRVVGDIGLADLPEAYRSTTPQKPLAGLERAERDAIVRALADCHGNKVKAALALGVSRTTLYARMRVLRITTTVG